MKNLISFFPLLITSILVLFYSKSHSQAFQSQADPLWKDSIMCSTHKIQEKGCLITDIAMDYNSGTWWSPSNTNRYFKTECAYSGSSCALNWNASTPGGIKFYSLGNVTVAFPINRTV